MGRRGTLVGSGEFEAVLQVSESAGQCEAGVGGTATELEKGEVVVGGVFENDVEGDEGGGVVTLITMEIGPGKCALGRVAASDGVRLSVGLAHMLPPAIPGAEA